MSLNQFVCVRNGSGIQSVQVFEEADHIEAAVCLELAREVEGLQAELFLGADLVDVVRSHEAFFSEAGS